MLLKSIQRIILLYSPLAVLLPLVVALLRFKKFGPDLKVLTYHLVMVTIMSGISAAVWFMNKNNLPLLHVYTILEFSMIAWFYKIVLRGWVSERLFTILILLFALLALLNSLFLQDWHRFNTYPRSLESIFVIAFTIAYFHRMLSEVNINRMERSPLFWINTGFLFYFSGALFLFSLSNYIIPLGYRLNFLIWTVHALFSILLYVFLFIGLCNHRSR